jgi:CO dehydrogenase maturation factor
MTTTIALAGKGGTGKTTVAALLIKYLLEQGEDRVLAIDADPSSNLNLVLGLPLETTVGDIREEMLDKVQANQFGAGTSKYDYLDYHIGVATVEGEGLDLLAMGRPEGQGCYCAVNNLMRMIIDRTSKDYNWVVIDNEAGMEHLSRRTTRDVDVLLIVTDPTVRGVAAAKGIAELARDLSINVTRSYLVVNRLAGELTPALKSAIAQIGIELAGNVPYDPLMVEFDSNGQPLVEANGDSAAYRAVQQITNVIRKT